MGYYLARGWEMARFMQKKDVRQVTHVRGTLKKGKPMEIGSISVVATGQISC